MYKIKQANKYKMKALIREYLSSLKTKYIPKNLTVFFDITFSLENHLAERIIERKVNKEAFERLITALIRDKLCEVIYLSLLDKGVRINLHDKTGLLLGITGTHYEDGCFNIKLRTCFVPDRHYKSVCVRSKHIYINN